MQTLHGTAMLATAENVSSALSLISKSLGLHTSLGTPPANKYPTQRHECTRSRLNLTRDRTYACAHHRFNRRLGLDRKAVAASLIRSARQQHEFVKTAGQVPLHTRDHSHSDCIYQIGVCSIVHLTYSSRLHTRFCLQRCACGTIMFTRAKHPRPVCCCVPRRCQEPSAAS